MLYSAKLKGRLDVRRRSVPRNKLALPDRTGAMRQHTRIMLLIAPRVKRLSY